MQVYLALLNALFDYGEKYNTLDVGHFDTVPEPDLTSALNAFWETRRTCHLLAATVRGTLPTSDTEEAVRREALVVYSALANPDDSTLVGLSEFSMDTVRALHQLALRRSLTSQDLPSSLDRWTV